jgi:hypothetical protein
MLNRERVIAALKAKADRFAGYQVSIDDARRAFKQVLNDVAAMDHTEIEARLEGILSPSARPTVEHDHHGVMVPFDQHWKNHEQARAWAKDVLLGVPTAAVDVADHPQQRDLALGGRHPDRLVCQPARC